MKNKHSGGKLEEFLIEEEFLDNKNYHSPFSRNDLVDAIQLGKKMMLKKIQEKIRGQVINGVCVGVITEDDLFNIEIDLLNRR